MLREAPKGFPAGLRAGGKPGGETPDLRVQDSSGGKRDFGPRAATGGPSGFGSRFPRAGSGFGPGAAKKADPGLRLMDAGRNRGFGLGSRRTRDRRLRPEEPPRREQGRKFQSAEANRQGFGPAGEPAGKPEEASASEGLRRKRRLSPRFGRRHSKKPDAGRLASQARFRRRDSGGRRRRRPPLSLGAAGARRIGRGNRSRCRPVSRHRA
jgi:hypothetical protein